MKWWTVTMNASTSSALLPQNYSNSSLLTSIKTPPKLLICNPNYSHNHRRSKLTLFFFRHNNHRLLSSPPKTIVHSPPRAVVSGDATFIQDAGVTALVLSGGYALVSAFDYLALNGVVPQNLSRKLVHILSGLFFMVSWPLFSTSTSARYFASLVPLANGLRLVIYGLSLVTDQALVKSVTREGKPEELLRGPLYYVLILALCAIVFWRESPVGLISLAMMSGGDGIADIMGRKFGVVKIPYNKNKSWAGSISMFLFGFLTSLVMLYYFSSLGYFELDWISTVKRVAIISFLASAVESLPSEELVDDNLSVPFATMIAAYICFSL